jgi:SMC interacting uncharacterized protein involved in chromosome segregation
MDKNQLKSLGTIVVLALLAGLIVGYFIWGKKEEKVDVKDLLRKAIEQVETIETQNQSYKAELEKMKDQSKAMAGITKDNQSLKEQIQKVQQDNKDLQAMIAQMKVASPESAGKPAAGEAQKQALDLEKEGAMLREQFEKCQQENRELQGLSSQLRDALSESEKKAGEVSELKTFSETLKNRIADLEKENVEMRSVLEKIGSLSVGKETKTHKETPAPQPPGSGQTK